MCGIFSLLDPFGVIHDQSLIQTEFEKGQARGPEFSKLEKHNFVTFGFHRLAINGLNDMSHQPIIDEDIILICNGEIYNYKSLYKMLDVTPKTDSDCEVIIHLYKKYGLNYTISMLDGVFSFCMYDKKKNTFMVGRDPYGVRPMYYCLINSVFLFSSEMKSISNFYNIVPGNQRIINQFPAGNYGTYIFQDKQLIHSEINKYFKFAFSSTIINYDEHALYKQIKYYFEKAVYKRVEACERPIACLLSGGLDSSLVCALVNKYYKEKSGNPIETYSIGMSGSVDLKYAKEVAEYIGSNHHEIELTSQDFLDAIPDVIKACETYDTTTIRASVGNYLVSKYIKEHSQAKVIFNGDGADELMGGYLYFHNAPTDLEFDYECKRLLSEISTFDVLRSDRSISAHGLEARTPFLDREFTQFYLSINAYVRNHNNFPEDNKEKRLIRNTFKQLLIDGRPILPLSILNRRKEAFSDGVSSSQKAWYEIIQENVDSKYATIPENTYKVNPPKTSEQYYYRDIFENLYPNCAHVIPHFWMPKFIEANDSSARSLSIYSALKDT